METYEQLRERYDREEKEALVKAQKKYDAYRADKTKKPIETYRDRDGGYTSYTYSEGTKETAKEIKVTQRIFRVSGDKVLYMHVTTNTRQKFLVVSGPLAGKRVIDDHEDYMLFNRNGRYGSEVPKCVLVHRASLKGVE